MRLVARGWTFGIACLSIAGILEAQQPAPATPAPAEQGKTSPQAKPAPAVQRAPRTAADSARALREPIDTVRLDAQPAGKAPDSLAVAPGRWRLSYFPYLTGSGGDLMVAARVRPWLPAFEDRSPYRAALNLDGGVGVHGSWFATARLDAPILWPDWRLVVVGAASEQNRLGFYDFGNNTLYDKSTADSTQPNLFRVQRTHYIGYVDASRRLIGNVFIAARGAIERSRFDALDGPSVFQRGYGNEVAENDLNGRIALVFDSRNNEYNTRSGLLWDVGFQAGGNGGDAYTRLYSVAKAYAPLRGSTVLAARVGFSDLRGTPTFTSRFEIPTWETPTSVYGGYTSNRGFVSGRFVGTGVVFGSIELRQDFLPIGEIAAGTLVAFLDAGRVFEDQDFSFTVDHLHVSGGIGIAARLLRSTIFTLNLARSGEGWHVSAGSGWAF
jgi:surface antigen Omp85-like protein